MASVIHETDKTIQLLSHVLALNAGRITANTRRDPDFSRLFATKKRRQSRESANILLTAISQILTARINTNPNLPLVDLPVAFKCEPDSLQGIKIQHLVWTSEGACPSARKEDGFSGASELRLSLVSLPPVVQAILKTRYSAVELPEDVDKIVQAAIESLDTGRDPLYLTDATSDFTFSIAMHDLILVLVRFDVMPPWWDTHFSGEFEVLLKALELNPLLTQEQFIDAGGREKRKARRVVWEARAQAIERAHIGNGAGHPSEVISKERPRATQTVVKTFVGSLPRSGWILEYLKTPELTYIESWRKFCDPPADWTNMEERRSADTYTSFTKILITELVDAFQRVVFPYPDEPYRPWAPFNSSMKDGADSVLTRLSTGFNLTNALGLPNPLSFRSAIHTCVTGPIYLDGWWSKQHGPILQLNANHAIHMGPAAIVLADKSLGLVVKLVLDEEAFNREVCALRRLADLPFIPKILGTSSGQPVWAIITTYEGEAIDYDDGLNDDVAPLVEDMVRQIHARGIHHHDIAPRNLLKKPTGGLVLIDFGQSMSGAACATKLQSCPDLRLDSYIYTSEEGRALY